MSPIIHQAFLVIAQFGNLETVIQYVEEDYRLVRRHNLEFRLLLGVAGFLMGIFFITPVSNVPGLGGVFESLPRFSVSIREKKKNDTCEKNPSLCQGQH